MCTGGRLLADFVAGGDEQPDVPGRVAEAFTTTTDGAWVVWAYKLARRYGDRFIPLTAGGSYPADAIAACRGGSAGRKHRAPDPFCTCGFHALSSSDLSGLPAFRRILCLQVVLSGRVLAFEWPQGVLFRAERQTVVRFSNLTATDVVLPDLVERYRRPDDPDSRVAKLPTATPHGSGPVRLSLPSHCPTVAIADDVGWCQMAFVEPPVGDTRTFVHI
jgi:hypothetical protein